jgi:hypothetical protein
LAATSNHVIGGVQRAFKDGTEPVSVALEGMRERHEQQHDDTDGDHSDFRHGRDNNATVGLQQYQVPTGRLCTQNSK